MQILHICPMHLLCLFHRYNIKGNSIPNRQLAQSRQISSNNGADFCIAPRCLPIRHEYNWIAIRWDLNGSKHSAIGDDIGAIDVFNRRPIQSKAHTVALNGQCIEFTAKITNTRFCKVLSLRAQYNAQRFMAFTAAPIKQNRIK